LKSFIRRKSKETIRLCTSSIEKGETIKNTALKLDKIIAVSPLRVVLITEKATNGSYKAYYLKDITIWVFALIS
jgi:hypothetical protein